MFNFVDPLLDIRFAVRDEAFTAEDMHVHHLARMLKDPNEGLFLPGMRESIAEASQTNDD